MSRSYGIKIGAVYSEGSNIRELFLNSLEISTEVVIVSDDALFIGAVFGGASPVCADNSVFGNIILFVPRKTEAVRENLINYSAFYPFGSAEIG